MIPPKAFLFDVFGTIVDWRSGVANVCRPVFVRKEITFDPFKFADLWRGEYQPAMEKIRSGNRGYMILDTLHRENLDRVLDKTGLSDEFNEVERANLNQAWEKLPGWEDSAAGLEAIKQKAIIAPCSNGSIALMTGLAKYAKLPWDCILGSEIARNYKPHPDAYLKSVAALGLTPNEVVMVAAHNDDLLAARENGLQTAFIPRPTEYGEGQTKDLKATHDWDYQIEKIGDLARLI